MAVLAVAAAGAAIGAGAATTIPALAGISALTAASVGWTVGSVVGNYFFGSSGSSINAENTYREGPRLRDLVARGGSYGADIPQVWGTLRVGGLIMWKQPIREERNTLTQEVGGGGGGGKGGKGGGGGSSTHTSTTYKYYATWACALCEGVAGVRKLWMNSKLVYDSTSGDAGFAAPYITVYLGEDNQSPDATMEAYDGVGNVPAYRGLCYIVIDDLPVEDFGNALPNLEAEVFKIETVACTAIGLTTGLGEISSGTLGQAFPARYGLFGYPTATFNWMERNYVNGPGGSYYAYFRRITSDSAGNEIARIPSGTGNGRYVGQYFTSQINPRTFEGGRYIAVGALLSGSFPRVIWDIEEDVVYDTQSVGADLYLVDFDWDNFGFDRYIYRVPGFDDRWWYIPQQYDSPTSWKVVIFTIRKEIPPEPAGLYVIKLSEGDLTFPVGFEPNQSFDHPYPMVSPSGVAYLSSTKTAISGANCTVYEINITEQGGVVPRWWSVGTFRDALRYGCVLGACFVTHGGTAQGHADYAVELNRSVADGSQLATYATLRSTGTQFPFFLAIDINHFLYDNGIVQVDGISSDYPCELSSVIRDTCLRSGLTELQIDVGDINETVIGYARTGQMTGRANIEGVSNLCRIDAVESGGKIRFQPICEAVIDTGITVLEDDLAARVGGENASDRLLLTRVQAADTPREVQISYLSQEQDYDLGVHRAFNPVANSEQILSLQLPVSMTGVQAKTIAQRYLDTTDYDRVTARWTLGPKHLQFEPGDVLTIETSRGSYQIRISKMGISPNGVQTFEGLVYDSISFQQAQIPLADEPPLGPVTLPQVIPSAVILLDIPVIRDVDTPYTGIYAAGYAVSIATWPGADLYHQIQTGWNLATYWSQDNEATFGVVDTPLSYVPHPWNWDDTSVMTVTMTKGTLSSSTDFDVQNGANQVAVGRHGRWEIIGFVNATDLGGNQYQLSRFLRARRGTEQFVGTGLINDQFVFLDTVGIRRATLQAGYINTQVNWRIVPTNSLIALASNIPFTHQGVDVTPFAPVEIAGYRITGDLRIEWTRRSRCALESEMGETYAICEDFERYELELRPSGSSAVLRTITVEDAQSVIYSLQAYRADSGDPAATEIPLLTVTIYQISAVVGRGYPGNTTL